LSSLASRRYCLATLAATFFLIGITFSLVTLSPSGPKALIYYRIVKYLNLSFKFKFSKFLVYILYVIVNVIFLAF